MPADTQHGALPQPCSAAATYGALQLLLNGSTLAWNSATVFTLPADQ